QFQNMHAPTFSETENPTAVLEWIKELDKIFVVLPLSDRQHVSLAAYQTKEDAFDWRIDHWARRPEAELNAFIWEQMKVMVRGKFLHQSFWDRMEHKFYHLQQGNSTVDEYIRTFPQMCLFAGDSVNTDAKKACKFLKGLNQRIHELVGIHGLMSYADTVSRDQEVESCLIQIAPISSYYHAYQPSQTVVQHAQPISSVSPSSSPGKRKSNFQNKKKEKKGNFGKRDNRPTSNQGCPRCGKSHSGECFANQRTYFNCNCPGHYANICRELKRQQQQQPPYPQQQQQLPTPPPHQQQQPPPFQQRAGGQARVYTITHDEASRNTGTMSGMLSISNIPVFVLCDTGATHYFISSRCLEALSISTMNSCDPLEISLASGKIIISDSLVRDLPVSIGGRVLI
ncbi:Unknown protein, partial [Striga hermonthica]